MGFGLALALALGLGLGFGFGFGFGLVGRATSAARYFILKSSKTLRLGSGLG